MSLRKFGSSVPAAIRIVLHRFATAAWLAGGVAALLAMAALPTRADPSGPELVVPGNVSVPAGLSVRITGIRLSDPAFADNPGQAALNLSAGAGTLAMSDEAAVVPASGSRQWQYRAALAATRAALQTLTYSAPHWPGSDTVRLEYHNQAGVVASATIAVRILPAGSTLAAVRRGDGNAADVQAARAQDLLNGFGINTHLDGCCNGPGGNYNDTEAVIRAIRSIGGVRLLRDFCQSDTLLTRAARVAQATGARFWCAIGETRPSDFAGQLGLMRRGHRSPERWVVAYEGPNEPDSPYSRSLGGPFLREAAAFMPSLRLAATEDGVPAIQTSFGVVYPQSHYGSTGNLSAYADYGNSHDYPQACPNCLGRYGTGSIDWLNREARKTTPGKPVAITEWGYTTPARSGYGAVSERNQAIYVLEYLLDAHQLGNPVYIYYGLLDDIAGSFGLFHNDFSPKLAALALSNFFALLRDEGADAVSFQPGRLSLHVHDMPHGPPNAGGRYALFQKSDGTFWLALWNEQVLNAYQSDNHDLDVPPVPIAVTFDAPVAVTQYDPIDHAAAPIATRHGTRIEMKLPAHPVLLHIEPH